MMRFTISSAAVLAMSLSGSVVAQDQAPSAPRSCSSITVPNPNAPERKPAPGLMTERSHNTLTKLYELVAEEKYVEAVDGFNTLLERTKSDAYTQAVVLQAIGHVRASQERYDEAVNYFKQSVNLDILPNRTQYQVMFQIAQLEVIQDQFRAGLQSLDRWFQATDEISVSAYELQANAYANLEEYRPAITSIKKAIAMCDTPKESWYNLLLAMHFELKEYPEAAEVLEILVAMVPEKRIYWTQLSSMYMQLKLDKKALATLALAHRRGLLDQESDYVQLYQLYGFMEIPYKAAEILQEGLDKGIIEPTKQRWEDLANAYYAARELDNALVAFEKAADLSLDGKLDMQRAYLLVELERWGQAREALAAAIEKGGLSDRETGNALVMHGMALYELCDGDAAETQFRQALRHESSRSSAQQWINHLGEGRSARSCA